MSTDPKNRPRFDDKDVSAIFSRAMELKKTAGQSDSSAGGGLTLAELEQIAAEVGIEPRYVQAAIAELQRGLQSDRRFQLWGGPMSIEFGDVVDGKVSDEMWAAMLQEIRRTLGRVGKTGQIGRSLEWTDQNVVQSNISVNPQNDQTKIHILSQQSGVAFLCFFFAGLAGAIASGVIGQEVPLPLVGKLAASLATLTGLFAAGRSIFGAWTRRERRKLSALLGRLKDIVAEPSPAALPESTSVTATGSALGGQRLFEEELEPESPRTGPPQRTRTSA